MKLKIFTLLSLLFLLGGCLRAKYPHRQEFLFDVQMPHYPVAAKYQRPFVLQVLNTTIAPQFASRQMVYRWDDLRYETDFYHIFFIAPNQQLTQIIAQWLQKSRKFSRTVTTTLLSANYFLMPHIEKLYIDMRDKAHPHAIIAIRFRLYHQQKYEKTLVLDAVFQQDLLLRDTSAPEVMHAWDVGITRILRKFTREL